MKLLAVGVLALACGAAGVFAVGGGSGSRGSMGENSGGESTPEPGKATLLPSLKQYLDTRATELDEISGEREEELDALAVAIKGLIDQKKPVRLNFICTHNSRRSHFGQIWSSAAAAYCGLEVHAYSGGTEATAFNPRAVAAASRAGFQIEDTTGGENPIYHVRFASNRPAVTCFSKRYDHPPNPKSDFVAIMVCTEADGACPLVEGSAARIAIPYVDPKVSDRTPAEAETYDERSAQIAREMLWVMRRVASHQSR
ncbi:MAG: protein-tyrosine-phosphatase [Planctomycetota bacterium]|nr:protein-tyrosine-phosphatase [Planctomycetota bacterium]